MLNEVEARKIAMTHMAPGSKFVRSTTSGNLFIFQINGPDPLEGDLDPFFSVNRITGKFIDFDPEEANRLFRQAERR